MSATTPDTILARLAELRAADAPTHGGRVLSYVYDSGLAELDQLATDAMRLVQPVNGLDPTTFTSVAVMERELVAFARDLLAGGDPDVVGNVTTGGTESCLLAVKTARDVWAAGASGPSGASGSSGVSTVDSGSAAARRPRLLAPVTVHAAFQKAAHYFGLELDLVPVQPSGVVAATDLVERMGPDVALVVVSAPSYPHAALDPVAEVAAAALERGISCHVDACIGGWVLPFWDGLPAWDLRVPGVTSLSADLHKFGYAPKGASVLLQRGRDRHRTQYFATTRWPGYPVVNPTMLGSKSAGPLAAAWAITQHLGLDGLRGLAQSCARSTEALRALVDGVEGLRVVGDPVGPLFAVATDESVPPERRVDPHHWADQVREHGFVLQLQPGLGDLPRTTHLTITPVTERVLPELGPALVAAADEVRGLAPVQVGPEQLGALLGGVLGAGVGALDSDTALSETALSGAGLLGSGPVAALPVALDSDTAWGLLQAAGAGGDGLPSRMAPLLALMEALPAPVAERLLTELLARAVEPTP